MSITASELRANIFKLLDKVLETGIPLEIARKGQVLKLIPAAPQSRLARLIRRDEFIKGDPGDLVQIDWSDEWKP